MIALFAILLPTIFSQATPSCSDQAGNQCFNRLSELQSANKCGSALLVSHEAMGHMMPSNVNWLSCACDELPEIVDCLEKSSCTIHKQAAEDFSDPVMHCDMDHHHVHGSDDDSSSSSSNVNSSSSSSNVNSKPTGAVTPSNAETTGMSPLKFAISALCVVALV